MNERTWVIAHNEDMIGRLSLEEIRAKRDAGEIDGTAVAWEPGSDEWRAVHDIPELRHLFPQPMTAEPSIPHWTPSSLSHLDPHHAPEESAPAAEPDLPADLPAIQPRSRKTDESLKRPPSLPWIATDLRPLVRPGFLIVAVAAVVLLGFQLVTQRVLQPPSRPSAMRGIELDLEPVVEEGEEAEEAAEPESPPPRRRSVARPVFDQKAIVAGVRANADDLDRCLTAARAAQEIVAGPLVLELEWTVLADGHVGNPRLTGPFNVLRTSLPGCVANHMAVWRFEPAPGRDVQVSGFKVKLQAY